MPTSSGVVATGPRRCREVLSSPEGTATVPQGSWQSPSRAGGSESSPRPQQAAAGLLLMHDLARLGQPAWGSCLEMLWGCGCPAPAVGFGTVPAPLQCRLVPVGCPVSAWSHPNLLGTRRARGQLLAAEGVRALGAHRALADGWCQPEQM